MSGSRFSDLGRCLLCSRVFAFLGVFALVLGRGALAQEARDVEAEFRAIVASVDETKEKIGKAEEALGKAEELVKANPRVGEETKKKLLDTIGESRKGLSQHAKGFEKLSGYGAQATSALDAYHEVCALKEALDGNLSDQLSYLARAMQQYGGDVPILGKPLEIYGEVTQKLVEATDRLEKGIRETRNQGAIGGPGFYGGTRDPRYRKLVEQFGKPFADADRFVPSSPIEVYRPDRDPSNPSPVALIWDKEAEGGGRWHRLEDVPVEQIFRDVRLAGGKRPAPAVLVRLGQDYEKTYRRQREAGDAMAGYFAAHAAIVARGGLDPAWTSVVARRTLQEPGSTVLQAVRTPEVFRAKFVYDPGFAEQAIRLLADLRRQMEQDGLTGGASEIDALARRYGISLPSRIPPSLELGKLSGEAAKNLLLKAVLRNSELPTGIIWEGPTFRNGTSTINPSWQGKKRIQCRTRSKDEDYQMHCDLRYQVSPDSLADFQAFYLSRGYRVCEGFPDGVIKDDVPGPRVFYYLYFWKGPHFNGLVYIDGYIDYTSTDEPCNPPHNARRAQAVAFLKAECVRIAKLICSRLPEEAVEGSARADGAGRGIPPHGAHWSWSVRPDWTQSAKYRSISFW